MLHETIRCEEGKAFHLPYHQRRLDDALRHLGNERGYPLESLIAPPEEGVWRCRFLYGTEGFEVAFHPYSPRKIGSLKLLDAPRLEYSLKYADRSGLDRLFEQRGGCDDVLIVRDGMVRDTTIANVALLIEGRWLTPEDPLLMGTTRARLIREGKIFTAPLSVRELPKASKIAVMNAMMGFVEVENGIIT